MVSDERAVDRPKSRQYGGTSCYAGTSRLNYSDYRAQAKGTKLNDVKIGQTTLIESPRVHQRFVRQAGTLYGALTALGFVAFFWLPDAMAMQQAHVQWWWAKLVMGLLVTLPLGALIGWLAASMRWTGLSILIWIAGGMAFAWIGGHMQFEGLSWLARLTDPYSADRMMYPFTPSAAAYTGISIVVGAGAGLLLGVLALFVTEHAWEYSTRNNRFSVKSILILCLSLPVTLMFGLLADFQINSPTREALTGVARMIETVRDPNADLVKSGLAPMRIYQGRLSPHYLLHLSDMDSELTGGSVDVQFDNGLLLRCPYRYSTVSRCDDLGQELTTAMKDLASVGYLTCADCQVTVEPDVRSWLSSNLPALGVVQNVEIVQHHEGWIYLRATFDSGRKIDCRFSGDRPIDIDLCVEAK